MIILSYIIKGHPDWTKSKIRIFAAFASKEIESNVKNLKNIVESGRLPLSFKNIIPVSFGKEGKTIEQVVEDYSRSTDLVLMGFVPRMLKEEGKKTFLKYPELNDVLFVSANQEILII
ncbi:MAG: hypothetical protein B5M53_02820 [Candidatus Cloacimonas sp. 4484_209]|nr:MAG: hypothetical protein B5M53_02820 [Candidatus Cloacimonas sp. 4484_209]